jgi:carbamoyl-phosphate synthase large subunit
MINILILGISGNVSQSIYRALKLSDFDSYVVGACVNKNSAGSFFCNEFIESPYADDEKFIAWLLETCNKHKIDFILTGVEEIIITLSNNSEKIKQSTNAIFISSRYQSLLIGQNKLLSNEFLKNYNLPHPKFALETMENVKLLVKEVGFPIIAKPILGKGSRGIFLLKDSKELTEFKNYNGYIFQEYIGNEESEYTVGCYVNKNNKILKPIIMKRKLFYGTTIEAQVVENSKIEKLALEICEKFKPIGPFNIQLRLDSNDNPVPFEFNVRFSGTTSIRAKLGFNDVEAMINEYFFSKSVENLEFKKGKAYRYFDEIVSID